MVVDSIIYGLKWEAGRVPDSLRFLSVYLVKIGIRYNRYIEKQAKAQESSQILHDFSQKKHSKARKTLTKQGEMYINVKKDLRACTKKTKRIHVQRYKLGGIYDEQDRINRSCS